MLSNLLRQQQPKRHHKPWATIVVVRMCYQRECAAAAARSAATLLFASLSTTSAAFDSFAAAGICGDSSKNWSPSASTASKKGPIWLSVITIIPLIKPILIRHKRTQAPTFRALFAIGFRFIGCVCWPFG
uniref:Uncharacterized protein n=1 Tax=Pseudo-nitzschia australis TaxID=44445 RepID=A0A7S4AE52_9STRA